MAKGSDNNAATSWRFPSVITWQPESNGYMSKCLALWACVTTVEDQKDVKEEDSEEWGKNWEMSKHVKENEGECGMERAGETQKGREFLLF